MGILYIHKNVPASFDPSSDNSVTTACLQCQAARSRSHWDNGEFCTVD